MTETLKRENIKLIQRKLSELIILFSSYLICSFEDKDIWSVVSNYGS